MHKLKEQGGGGAYGFFIWDFTYNQLTFNCL